MLYFPPRVCKQYIILNHMFFQCWKICLWGHQTRLQFVVMANQGGSCALLLCSLHSILCTLTSMCPSFAPCVPPCTSTLSYTPLVPHCILSWAPCVFLYPLATTALSVPQCQPLAPYIHLFCPLVLLVGSTWTLLQPTTPLCPLDPLTPST